MQFCFLFSMFAFRWYSLYIKKNTLWYIQAGYGLKGQSVKQQEQKIVWVNIRKQWPSMCVCIFQVFSGSETAPQINPTILLMCKCVCMVGFKFACTCCFSEEDGSGSGSGSRSRWWREGRRTLILLVIASVYKRSQTAAAPTPSSPCSKRRSVSEEEVWHTVQNTRHSTTTHIVSVTRLSFLDVWGV